MFSECVSQQRNTHTVACLGKIPSAIPQVFQPVSTGVDIDPSPVETEGSPLNQKTSKLFSAEI